MYFRWQARRSASHAEVRPVGDLVFIGIKMLIVDFYHIPIAISLGVGFGILIVTLIINTWVNRPHDKKQQA
jgi:predicted tellurium resistance membrane protein TerC